MEPSPQRSPGKQFAFSNENEVCKQDFFIKSPPSQLFTSLASWKKRFFILSKNGSKGYSLSYYKDHHHRGVIEINGDSIIEVGISNEEKLQSVQKMFQCQPEEVMSIRTTKREYFLIGQNSEKIKEWVSIMSTLSRWELKAAPQNTEEFPMDNHRLSAALNFLASPFSMPEAASTSSQSDLPYMLLSTSSSSHQSPHVKPFIGSPLEFRKAYQPFELLSVTAQDTEENSHYAVPRNIPLELNKVLAENPIDASINLDRTEKIFKRDETIYMTMKSRVPQDKTHQPADSQEKTQSLPETQPEPSHLQEDSGENEGLCPVSAKAETMNEEKEPASLTMVQLSILINNITDDSQVEKLNVCLSVAEILDYLSFVEAAGRICVAQWEGPAHLGCLFFHGDHLLAVNDLVPRNLEEVSLFLSRCVQKMKVKLTIGRIQNSEKFHAQSCACSLKYKGIVPLELDTSKLPRTPKRSPAIRKTSQKDID